MLDYLKQLFKEDQADVIEQLSDDSVHQASLALLVSCANADHSLDVRELDTIRMIASKHFDLNVAQTEALIERASDQTEASTSLYEFTSLINAHFDAAQKFQLISDLWRIAWADGRIDRYEEHLIRRIADLVYVEHARFIEAKLTTQADKDADHNNGAAQPSDDKQA